MRFSYLTNASLDAIYAWAKRLIDDLNRGGELAGLPVFADDAAAAAGRVGVDEGYVTPDGIVRRRVA